VAIVLKGFGSEARCLPESVIGEGATGELSEDMLVLGNDGAEFIDRRE